MAFANRGVFAEKKVKEFLEKWQGASAFREFSRLTDSKAAGRIIKAAPADFEYFNGPAKAFGLIEVKETEHLYRLARDKVPQLPRLRKREKCGGQCYVVVYHSHSQVWRVVGTQYLASTGDKGSWNLTDVPQFASVEAALHAIAPEVFRV